jgi:hypothetical protein
MGFNLKMFFDELQVILDSRLSDKEKIRDIVKAVIYAKKYAKECGLL